MTPQLKVAGISAAVCALTAALVMPAEGLRLMPYRDPVGIVTDCWGHTKTAKLGQVNTPADCRRKLEGDFAEHDAGLRLCVKVDMPDHVHAAVLSFTFNVGVAKACASALVRKLNAGDVLGACAELSRWTLAGGRELPGLVKRRAAERETCEGRPASLGVQG
ncbi:MAG TPA: lysozyme [Ramlibacter sp.]|nr:lysozyme [Ramlibacter sp.]